MKPSSRLHIFLLLAAITLSCFAAIAQNSQNPQTSKKIKVSLVLQEVASDEPIGFATVSLTRKGADKAAYYAVANSEGYAEFNGVAPGDYTLKAELLGYNPFSREIEVKGGLNLGVCRMEPDVEQLDAARVSASLNPVVVKKDTVEYSANYFKSTDTDMLADLLKKLPGAEVDENGTVTINGEQVKKITIEGKTFFLNDPQIATQNIPAKMINKLKLIEKKSEQAEFTGIDDGERETVIDLSLNPGRMRGFFANATAGVGRDIMDHGKTSAIAEQADSWQAHSRGVSPRRTRLPGSLGGTTPTTRG